MVNPKVGVSRSVRNPNLRGRSATHSTIGEVGWLDEDAPDPLCGEGARVPLLAGFGLDLGVREWRFGRALGFDLGLVQGLQCTSFLISGRLSGSLFCESFDLIRR